MRIFGLLLILPTLAGATVWPGETWPRATLQSVGIDTAKFQHVRDFVFERKQTVPQMHSDALLVIRHGRLVHEEYVEPYARDRRHILWSISKSVLSLLVGIAEKEGRLSREALAYRYYRALDRPRAREIRVKHLLEMTPGFKWRETYVNPLSSSVLMMLFSLGRGDMGGYTAGREVVYAPGSHYQYSSGTSNVLAQVYRGALKNMTSTQHAWSRLFVPLGIKSAVWETDRTGTLIGSSYLYLNARDLARIGYLALKKGSWRGKQLLPLDWISYSSRLNLTFSRMADLGSRDRSFPAAHWWVGQAGADYDLWEPAPAGTFAALGHEGQHLFVVPAWNMVVVRLGTDRGRVFDRKKFFALLKDSMRFQDALVKK